MAESKLVKYGKHLAPAGSPAIEPGSNAAIAAILLKTRELARFANVEDPETLYACLDRYLEFCIASNTKITNRSLYAACGVTEDMVTDWITGRSRTADPRYREFGLAARQICSQAREQAGAEGCLSPVLTIWWQKNYDGFRDIPTPVKVQNGELERTVDPQEIAEKYKHLLTDDSGERMERDKAVRDSFDVMLDDIIEEETGKRPNHRPHKYKPKGNTPTSSKSAPKRRGTPKNDN